MLATMPAVPPGSRRGEETARRAGAGPGVGVVGDHDVALIEVVQHLEHMLRRLRQAEEHEGAEVGLSQDTSPGIQDGAVDVLDLLDDGGAAHPHLVLAHVVGDGVQAVADDTAW